jgi:FtsP/CotA-like multicopper oxidase with cupredoxin domain
MSGFRSIRRRVVTLAVTLLCASQGTGVGASPVSGTAAGSRFQGAGISRPAPQPTGQWQPTRSRVKPGPRLARGARALAAGAALQSESFTGIATTPNAWLGIGDACLTAGTSATPATSISACGTQAPVDAAGSGALQLTSGTGEQLGMIVTKNALSTANGLQITFTDYAFDGTNPGADGMTFFLSDASKPMPTAAGDSGGSIGYANGTNANLTGIANAYVGVALDQFGNFSNPTQGRAGGPGQIAQTIAARGAASIDWAYLGGALNGSGVAASLPFAIDAPTATTRPATAPTIVATLTAAGVLTVAIDRHDGNGPVTYYSQTIVGVAGEPAVPASVYFGFTSSTGGSYSVHQVSGLTIAALAAVAPPPPPSGFTPASVSNLTAWYDASTTANLSVFGSSVAAFNDKSGKANTLAQPTASREPTYTASGINGLGSLVFSGAQYLMSANTAFSTNLFNESTVFVVANQTNTVDSSVLWSGAYLADPRWNLRLSETGVSHFDLNNKGSGRLAVADKPPGPARWTAAGSFGNHAQYLRKNGNLVGSDTGPTAPATGSYPLTLGATVSTQGGTSSYSYSGQLGEVVTYNRYLTAAESAEVEGYLACKWGLQTRLPANHPYRYSCPQGGTFPSLPITPPASGALVDPPQLRSSGGSLTVNITAQQNASTGNPQFSYNGAAVLPTLRLLPGDTLNVTLTNSLATPPAGSGYTNDVNLHYHGLHVSPLAPSDDSIDMIAAPGQTLVYHVKIPTTHPTGLYWYHTHVHGETERDTLAGMSGALIVDGIVATAPQVANLPERVLLVRDAPLAGTALPAANRQQIAAMKWAMAHGVNSGALRGVRMNGMSLHGTMGRGMAAEFRGSTNASVRNPYVSVDRNYRRFVRPSAGGDGQCGSTPQAAVKALTLNGQTQPSIGIRPGEQQFWRVVNAGADTYIDLQVDNTTMTVVALDGVPLGSGVNTPASMSVSHYVVPPGGRVEFIVTGPTAGTTAYLRTNCFDSGSAGQPMPGAILATINPNASLSDQARLRHGQRFSPAAHTVRFRSAARLRTLAVNNTRTIYYSDQNNINGVAYDPAAPPMFYVQSGTTEEWTIQNNSSQVHTFHIHQVHFVVEAINGVTQSQQYVMDDVNVPAATTSGPGLVKVLLDFTDPTIIGTFLLHCHILSHEDGGMMAKIRVGTAPPLTVSSSSVTFAGATAAAQTVSIAGGEAPYAVSGCSGVVNASVSGNTVSLSPVAAGGCVLTIADSSNPSITATVTIAVNAGAAAITIAPNTLSFASATAASQNVSVSGGTAPYTLSGCTGIAAGTLSGQTLTVVPQAAGACTLVVTDANKNTASLSVSVNAAVSGSPQDNDTFHQNAMRTGWYQSETALTTSNVNSTSFGTVASLVAPSGMPAFGKVYAQPLYATSETGPDGLKHNLVIVATSTDQVYAFDDVTRAVVWHRDFTNAAAGVRQQLWSDTNCSDINPNVGITGTPVIDRAMDRMYLVAATMENGTAYLRLHAIALSSGAEISNTPITGSVTLATGGTASISGLTNNNRSALLEANGNIYVTLASHCDYSTNTTHGWVLAYDAATLAETGSLVDLTNADPGSSYFLGSPWMGGYGPAADSLGNVYFATGNGAFNGTTDFAMSVIKVPGNLNLGATSFFAPASAVADSNSDSDLGSGGVMVLPDQTTGLPHLLVQGGKCGQAGCMKYILNRDAMGGQRTGDAGAVWSGNTGGGIWGGPAYFRDSNGKQYVVYGTGQPLSTYQLTSPTALTVQSSANVGCLECRDSGSQPVVSSNGTTAGSAIVWALQTPGNGGGNISLFAFNALNMGTTLFSGTAGTWTQASGTQWIGGALVSPLIANGKVYVPVDGAVTVFGLH